MALATQNATEAEFRKRWACLVRWTACILAINLVCGLLFAVAVSHSTSVHVRSKAESQVEPRRSKASSLCRVIAGTVIKSL